MDRLWTADLVERRLVEAFATLGRAPTLNTRGGILKDAGGVHRITGPDLIAIVQRLLEAEEPARSALIVWAKNQAGLTELAVPVFMERRSIKSRQSFDAMRHRAARVVADGINAVILLTSSLAEEPALERA